MSNFKDVFKSSASILSSQLASALISIIFLAYFARVFSKEQMAVYATLTILLAWNEVIGGLGMGTLLIKDIPGLIAGRHDEQARKLISSVFVYRTWGLLAVSLVWALLLPFGFTWFFTDSGNLGLLQLAVVIAFFMAMRAQVGHVQVAVQSFHSRSIINVVTTFAQRLFCVIGFFLFGLTGFYAGFLAGTLVGLALGLWDIRSWLVPRLLPARGIFTASRSYWGLKWVRSAIMHVDRPLVATLLGPEGLASYHLAKRLYDNLYTVMTSFAVPMGVKFGELQAGGSDHLDAFYRQSIAVTGFVFLPLGFFVAALSAPIQNLYAGPKYAADDQLLAAFGITLIGVAFWTLLREVALRLVSAGYLAIQYLVTAAITTGGYLLLVPLFGVAGVPLAMTAGFCLGCFPLARILRSNCNLHLPLEALLQPALFSVALFVLLYPLRYLDSEMVSLLAGSAGAILAYIAWLSRYGPQEVQAIIHGRFRRFLPCKP